MNRCKDCKWWGGQTLCTSYGKENPLIDLYGLCNNPKLSINAYHHGDKWRPFGTLVARDRAPEEWCVKNEVEREASHTLPLDYAEPIASDDHGLCFSTGPEFGCVHWEAKP